MSILDLGGPVERSPRKKRAVKVWVGIGLIAAVLGIGSTLAANITINGGNTTEFGQGVQRTIYCGTGRDIEAKISVTPLANFDNTAFNGETRTSNSNDRNQPRSQSAQAEDDSNQVDVGKFFLGGIRVSDIPSECSGVDFVVTVYDNAGNPTPLVLDSQNGMTSPTVWFVNGCTSRIQDCMSDSSTAIIAAGGHGGVLSSDRTGYVKALGATLINTKRGEFTIKLQPNLSKDRLTTDQVGEITIETQNDAFGLDTYLNAGDYLLTKSDLVHAL
jgi:hypothetical protein